MTEARGETRMPTALRTNRLPLVALLTANAISGVGNVLTALAIPWFVLQTTGSPTQAGVAGFFAIAPVVIASFFGGALVDRLGFKASSIVADVASGVTVALIPALFARGWLPFWLLLVLVFFGALLDAPGQTARSSLVPDLAERGGLGLERVTAAVQIVSRSTRLVGAPLAGVLIAAFGAGAALTIDAATFAVSAGLVAVAVPAIGTTAESGRAGYLAEMREGLRFIQADRLVRALLLVLVVTNVLDAMWSAVVGPVFAERVYGSAVALGLIFGVSGGGAVAGALVYGAVGHRWPRRPLFIGGFVVAATRFALLALLPILPVTLAIQAITGAGAGPLNPMLDTMMYERIPAQLRGRVIGAAVAIAFIGMPLGALIAGPLIGWAGLRGALLLMGGAYLAATLSMVATPAIRRMERPPSPEAAL
jgi:MFS family permease